MDVRADLVAVAALIGEPARALMLWSLLDGEERPACELAFYANVSAQSASSHLSKLVDAGLIDVTSHGRHRYFRIARPEVGLALEAMVALTPAAQLAAKTSTRQASDMKLARTCYDHLAGKVGVGLCAAMKQIGWLLETKNRQFELTPIGTLELNRLGIETEALRHERRVFALQCLDWSERQSHLAGALGAALLQRLIDLQWISKMKKSRVVRVTAKGETELRRRFSLVL